MGTGGKAARGWRWPPTPNLAPSLKKEQSYSSTPPLAIRGLLQDEIYLYHNLCYSPKITAVAQWLRCCATNRKVAGSIPDVSGIFH